MPVFFNLSAAFIGLWIFIINIKIYTIIIIYLVFQIITDSDRHIIIKYNAILNLKWLSRPCHRDQLLSDTRRCPGTRGWSLNSYRSRFRSSFSVRSLLARLRPVKIKFLQNTWEYSSHISLAIYRASSWVQRARDWLCWVDRAKLPIWVVVITDLRVDEYIDIDL